MEKFKIKKTYTCLIDEDDLKLLNMYASENDLTMPFCIRRGVKDFIKNYVEQNKMPPSEKINLGTRNKYTEKILGEKS